MSHALRHAARVDEKGVLVFADPPGWRRAVARHRGYQVWVTVTRQTKPHTDNQRAYYHAVVVEMIAAEIGETHDETHDTLKNKFLIGRTKQLSSGLLLQMPPSTKPLTTEQMTAYIEEVRTWAAQWLGLSIPDPNQVEVSL